MMQSKTHRDRETGPLRVAIDCRIDDPRQGIGTAILALAHGLSKVQSNQSHTFIVFEHLVDWLQPYVSGPCSIMGIAIPMHSRLRKVASRQPLLRYIRRKLTKGIAASDGVVETGGYNVVHFPTQAAYLTRVPSIYQPWDLQHLHYPEFFTRDEVAGRELRYRAYCEQAGSVCVQTEWGKRDIVAQYGISAEKVKVIPWGSAFEAYEATEPVDADQAIADSTMPDQFMIYPAVTWPHKNHAVILQALAELQKRGARVPCVIFTGTITSFHRELSSLAASLNVESKVRFLGFVTTAQLQMLYERATAMIFASKFEGLGLPVIEAFRSGLPVICSTATVLPEVAGDASLYFDPNAPAQLADAITLLMTSESLRTDLKRRGTRMLQKYSALAAAQEFVKLYEHVAHVPTRVT